MSEYYVFNLRDAKKGWMDRCIVWWRPNGNGYTYDLNEAGVYTEADRAKGYPPENSEVIWVPKDLVDKHCTLPRLAWWEMTWRNPIKPILEQWKLRQLVREEVNGQVKVKLDAAPAAMKEALTELAAAKRQGAAEELRRLAQWWDERTADASAVDVYSAALRARADEMEGKNG